MDMVLVLSDDVAAASRVATILQRTFLVDRALSLREAKFAIKGGEHAGVIMNLEFASRGRVTAAVKELLAYGSKPILVLTGHQKEADIVQIFHAGADECLPPTVAGVELLARARAMIRRQGNHLPVGADIVIGALRINPVGRVVTLDGRIIELAGREFDLLLALARRPGYTFGLHELQKALWGEHSPGRLNVNTYITRLRQKMGEVAGRPRFLHTVYGKGLKLHGSGAGQPATLTYPSIGDEPVEWGRPDR